MFHVSESNLNIVNRKPPAACWEAGDVMLGEVHRPRGLVVHGLGLYLLQLPLLGPLLAAPLPGAFVPAGLGAQSLREGPDVSPNYPLASCVFRREGQSKLVIVIHWDRYY